MGCSEVPLQDSATPRWMGSDVDRSDSRGYTRPEQTEPGGQAKWVRIPRGAATVSGEPHPQAGKAGCHCCAERNERFAKANGKAGMERDDPRARIPGGRAVPFPSARDTPRRSRDASSLRPCSSVSQSAACPDLLAPRALHAAAPITGRVVDESGRAGARRPGDRLGEGPLATASADDATASSCSTLRPRPGRATRPRLDGRLQRRVGDHRRLDGGASTSARITLGVSAVSEVDRRVRESGRDAADAR